MVVVVVNGIVFVVLIVITVVLAGLVLSLFSLSLNRQIDSVVAPLLVFFGICVCILVHQ